MDPPQLDLAALRRSRSPVKRIAEPRPNYSMQDVDTTARMQLISPPPEETLRRVSSQRPPSFTPSLLAEEPTTKRKRTEQTTPRVASDAATPNPRSRKQVRRETDDVDMELPTRSVFHSPPPLPTSPSRRVLLQSPHFKNPDADYIPSVQLLTRSSPPGDAVSELGSVVRRKLLSAKSSRRSATPIPSYEPPKDVFTPPREVVISPNPPTTLRKSSRRHAIAKQLTHVQVKQEMPAIDLSIPMPPPSPTDDPLLLSSDIEELDQLPPLLHKTPKAKKTKRATKKTPGSAKTILLQSTSTAEAAEVVLHEVQEETPRRVVLDFDLPPSSPIPESDDEGNYDWTQGATQPMESTEDSMMQMDSVDEDVQPIALLDFDAALQENVVAGGWSDSDEEEEEERLEVEGRGEYTGRWRLLKVRTKADPPSDATRERMEDWGRPISPFPGVRRLFMDGPLPCSEVEEEEVREEEEVMRMSIEPGEEATEPDFTPAPRGEPTTPTQQFEFNPAVEQQIEEPTTSTLDFTPARRIIVDENVQVADDVDSNDGDGEDISDIEDFSMVKIISADPMAAARAAAILKQYDYECFTKLSIKQRKMDRRRYSSLDDFSHDSRRKNLLGSGISKAEKKRRRSTLGMGVLGDTVVIAGSPSITLPELLDQAEKEVLLSSPEKSKHTPLPSSRLLRHQFETPVVVARYEVPLSVWGGSGERPWTKEEWKWLDSCLTDERMEGNDALSPVLKPVDGVNLESVVERFVGMAGGDRVVAKYGPTWSRDSLRQRVRALQKKQRAGNVAPPTTPISALGGEKRLPSMEVPDFTPLGRRALPPRKSRPSLPPPITENAPFSSLRKPIAPYLLAPRYSHLLEEARVLSAELTELSGAESKQEKEEEKEPGPTPQLSLEPRLDPKTPATFGKKLRGIFFSYMPTLSKTAPPPSRREVRPGLPLPPPDVLNKDRGPIATPARPALPKVKHPKELVELHPAPKPKPSMIPRLNRQPRRLVELHPVVAGSMPPLPPPPPRPRRSSGSSVKDLVKGFEQMKEAENKEVQLTQQRSHSNLGVGSMAGAGSLMSLGKPTWR